MNTFLGVFGPEHLVVVRAWRLRRTVFNFVQHLTLDSLLVIRARDLLFASGSVIRGPHLLFLYDCNSVHIGNSWFFVEAPALGRGALERFNGDRVVGGAWHVAAGRLSFREDVGNVCTLCLGVVLPAGLVLDFVHLVSRVGNCIVSDAAVILLRTL